MSLSATVELQKPTKGQSGTYPCRCCRKETAQEVLTIVNSRDSDESGEVDFWGHYLTVRCKGCGTVNFCIVSKCSEEFDYDARGNPYLVVTKRGYPEVEEEESEQEPEDGYVHADRLAELASLLNTPFDGARLVKMLDELNRAYAAGSYISCICLIRGIIDHVPPIFGCRNFGEVANNYGGGGRSFKDAMLGLDTMSRKIADSHLHSQIRAVETVPNANQVEFRAGLDVLLAEIIRIARAGPKP